MRENTDYFELHKIVHQYQRIRVLGSGRNERLYRLTPSQSFPESTERSPFTGPQKPIQDSKVGRTSNVRLFGFQIWNDNQSRSRSYLGHQIGITLESEADVYGCDQASHLLLHRK
ncbi:hypothetical protein PoB_000118100 [Plakobranchus ocellatus]|uniref:Uncharacterized protein n=1 Tax=Plakobranchus ocellatus TaxID=259542 RepID=A0AAV3WXS8_9GAST|nr:hypothetical protein PoB_000118100 [Plakobranchus ocellatus]